MIKQNFSIKLLNKEGIDFNSKVSLTTAPKDPQMYIPKNREFTIEIKIKPQYKSEHTLITYYCFGENKEDFCEYFKLSLIEKNILSFRILSEKKYIKKSISDIDFYDNQWHHIAITLKNKEITIYVDGRECENTDVTLSNKFLDDIYNEEFKYSLLFTGGSIFANNPVYYGEIDEIRIWSCARSENEIIEFMNKGLDLKNQKLLGYWNFDDKNTKDLSLYGNDLEITGKKQNAQYILVSTYKENNTIKHCYDVKYITGVLMKNLMSDKTNK